MNVMGWEEVGNNILASGPCGSFPAGITGEFS